MTLSHIVLRRREPDLERPYRTPGGSLTSGVAFGLSIVAFVSTFLASLEAAVWSAVFYLIMVAYFFLYSRHHLVANAPEEEFEAHCPGRAGTRLIRGQTPCPYPPTCSRRVVPV